MNGNSNARDEVHVETNHRFTKYKNYKATTEYWDYAIIHWDYTSLNSYRPTFTLWSTNCLSFENYYMVVRDSHPISAKHLTDTVFCLKQSFPLFHHFRLKWTHLLSWSQMYNTCIQDDNLLIPYTSTNPIYQPKCTNTTPTSETVWLYVTIQPIHLWLFVEHTRECNNRENTDICNILTAEGYIWITYDQTVCYNYWCFETLQSRG